MSLWLPLLPLLLWVLWLLLRPGRASISAERRGRLISRLDAWALFARQKGLYWRETRDMVGSEMSGHIDGLRIRAVVSEAPSSRRSEPLEVRLEIEIRAGFPPEMERLHNSQLIPVGFALVVPEIKPWGSGLLVQREHRESLREVFAERGTLAEVAVFLQQHSGRIYRCQLEAFHSGVPDPRGAIERMVALSSRIQSAWELGLIFQSMGDQGFWWLVRCSRTDIELTARIRGVPKGMRVASTGTGGQRSGNPILDHLLHIEGPAPCLKEPGLSGALMAALHPYPGASFDESGLIIPAPALTPIAGLLRLAAAVHEEMPRVADEAR